MNWLKQWVWLVLDRPLPCTLILEPLSPQGLTRPQPGLALLGSACSLARTGGTSLSLRSDEDSSQLLPDHDFIPADQEWSQLLSGLGRGSLQAPRAAVWLTHVSFGATADLNCRESPARGFWPSQSSVDPSKS